MITINCRLLIVAAAIPALLSCSKTDPARSGESAAAPAAKHEEEEHGGQVEEETSDLDRPLEELFAERCEHDRKTFECDECRYEIGVVKAPASLFEGGLIKVVKAERRRVETPLELAGEVRFDERRVADVSSLAEGIIRKVQVTLGDKVKRGQGLVEIESVAVGEAEAAYLEARTTLGLARSSFARVEALRRENIASEREFLQANQELEAAGIMTEGALGRLVRLGMDATEAGALSQNTARGRLVLRAPADGTVLDLHAVPGEVARSEESLLTIGDNASLWVWADLYERDVAVVMREQAKQPLAAQVEVKAYPGEEFPGTVDFISPVMSETSRTVKLRIRTPNPGGRLLAGMFATVKVFIPGAEQALAVPKAAVLEDEGRSFVFIHSRGDYYVRRPVTTGHAFAGWIEIAGGLQGGEKVVGDGAFLMKSDVLRSKMGAGCAD